MSLKKIFWLASGYIAWNVVSSLYNNKKWKDLKTTIKKAKDQWKDNTSIIFENLLDTHKNLIEDLNKIIFSEENKDLFKNKKWELTKIIKSFKEEWEEIINTLKKDWTVKISDLKKKLEDLYKNREELLNKVKDVSPELVDKFKGKLTKFMEESKKKLNK